MTARPPPYCVRLFAPRLLSLKRTLLILFAAALTAALIFYTIKL